MDASHYLKEWLGKTVIILTALFEIRTFEAQISFIQAIRNCFRSEEHTSELQSPS